MRVLVPIVLFASLIISGCSSLTGYQIVSTEPLNDETSMTFQNEDCLIEFDFWDSHGNPGFVIQNKSEDNIVLNLDSCFYISNGEMNDLFLQREYSSSKSSTSSLTSSASIIDKLKQNTQSYYNLSGSALGSSSASATNEKSSERGIIQQEKRRLIISPGAKRSITEYSILNRTYRFCNLQRNPYNKLSKKMSNSFDYSSENSPLIFSIIINYSTSSNTITKNFDFYISSIENLKKDDVMKDVLEDDCGNKLWGTYIELEDLGEKKFYIRYSIER